MTSPSGKAESTCPQNQPNLVQTQRLGNRSYRTGTCHYYDSGSRTCPQLGSCPRAHDLYPGRPRSPLPNPPPARSAALRPRPPPGRRQSRLLPTKSPQTHVPRAPPPRKPKGCARGRERAGRHKSQSKPRTAHALPRRYLMLTNWGFPRLESELGGGVPRGSPVSVTGRAEARRPRPRRPFHSQGPGRRGARTQ